MYSLKQRKTLTDIFYAPNVNSGEEFDYTNVEVGGHYNFASFNRKGVFVLPPNPQVGDVIYFSDREGSTKWFPTVIHRNGNAIMGENEHMTCDVPNISFKMAFLGGYLGWQVLSDLTLFKGNN